MPTNPNKEQIYDDQISPLMKQILEICQKHGIAMLASFAIPTPDDPDLNCSSLVPSEDGEHPAHHRRAFRALRGDGGAVLAMTTISPKPTAH